MVLSRVEIEGLCEQKDPTRANFATLSFPFADHIDVDFTCVYASMQAPEVYPKRREKRKWRLAGHVTV